MKKEKAMNHNCKCETIEAMLHTCHSDDTKIYFIQSYLLGWTSEEQMQAIISRG